MTVLVCAFAAMAAVERSAPATPLMQLLQGASGTSPASGPIPPESPAEPAANASPSTPSPTVTIIAVGPRSLRDAVLMLATEFDTPITYEDPGYFHSALTAPAYPGGPQEPISHRLEVTFTKTSSLTPLAATRMLVDSYAGIDKSVVFAVRSGHLDPAVTHIYPVSWLTDGGVMTAHNPVLTAFVALNVRDDLTNVPGRIEQSLSRRYAIGSVTFVSPVIPANRQAFELNGAMPSRDLLDVLLKAPNWSAAMSQTWSFTRYADPNLGTIEFDSLDAMRPPVVNSTTLLSVDSLRPVADLTSIVAQESHGMLVYEDPVYGAPSTVNRSLAGDILSPRGGAVKFYYDNTATTDVQESGAVSAAGAQFPIYRFADSSLADGDASYVYPTTYQNPGVVSDTEPIAPLLNTPLAGVTQMVGTPAQIVALVCSKVSTSAAPVAVGSLGPLASGGKMIIETIHPLTGAQWLAQLASGIGHPVSFMLLYDPVTKSYTMNVLDNS